MAGPQIHGTAHPSRPDEESWDWHSWQGALLVHGCVVLAWATIGLLADAASLGVVSFFTAGMAMFLDAMWDIGFRGLPDMFVASWLTGAVYFLPVLFYVRTRKKAWLYALIPVVFLGILMTRWAIMARLG